MSQPSSRPPRGPVQPQVPISSRRRHYSSSSAAVGPFSYHIAAGFVGKSQPFDATKNTFYFRNRDATAPNASPPRRTARYPSGQDAFFVSRVGAHSPDGNVAVAVADGVGGWSDSGVDSADFSHGLCHYMRVAAYHHGGPGQRPAWIPPPAEDEIVVDELRSVTGAGPLSAKKLLQEGYDAVCADPSVSGGGSTACVGVFAPNGTVDIANLGDSGVLLLRLGAVWARSKPQTHDFNTPYQLTHVSPAMARRMAIFGLGHHHDMPSDADVLAGHNPLRDGDVLVFGTDGLWDNLFDQDVLHLVSQRMLKSGAWKQSAPDEAISVAEGLRPATDSAVAGEGRTVQDLLATEITEATKAASESRHIDGPFASTVRKYYKNRRWQGGKVDDICVVVVVVSETTKSKL